MRFTRSSLSAGSLALLMALGGCGGGEGNESLASLDARLTNGVAATDETQANAANESATDGPQASRERNPLDRSGTSAQTDPASASDGPRLADVAERQRAARAIDRVRMAGGVRSGSETDGCGRRITYGAEWARDLPVAFALYPGGKLVEAAGVSTDRCTLRVVSFTSDAAPVAVARHYADRASAAGFSAERRPCEGGQMVGGVHPATDQAYIVLVTAAAGGRTNVDIVLTLG